MKFNPTTLRKNILRMAYVGSSVHIGCAFSIVEILAVLYREFLNYPNNNPKDPNRDYFLLSKGHGVMAQYACMLELGWLDDCDINNYFKNGSKLKGLSESSVLGIETTSGSLGHGLSVGVGLALASKFNNSKQKTYVVVGDGEINEGSIWEGVMFAAHHNLNNLMIIIDQNRYQAMNKTRNIIDLEPIESIFRSFGFDVAVINGHNQQNISQTIQELWAVNNNKPKAIIANTIKGKGVDFMENNNLWHYSRLTNKSFHAAIDFLDKS